MTARFSGGRWLYYHQRDGKKTPLGEDLSAARLRWAALENGNEQPAVADVRGLVEAWRKAEMAKRRFSTQRGYESYRTRIVEAFGHFPLESVKPKHIRQYLDKRTSKVGANREIGMLGTAWNWARETGVTELPNPTAGVRKNRETPRTRYITDAEFADARARAPRFLQDAMDLALLTGQRVGDILKMHRQDIRDGLLMVTQGKTGAKLGIRVQGELERVLDRLRARPVTSMRLVADDAGQPLTIYQVWYAWSKLDVDFHFHDIRAKVATDSGDIKQAQQLLGHKSERVTADVYRRFKSNVVDPLR
jgi:integrase